MKLVKLKKGYVFDPFKGFIFGKSGIRYAKTHYYADVDEGVIYTIPHFCNSKPDRIAKPIDTLKEEQND